MKKTFTDGGIIQNPKPKMQTNLGTCWYDVEAAWLLLLTQGVLGPAQDGPVIQLVEWAG